MQEYTSSPPLVPADFPPRKRSRRDTASSSSDTPIFSSDDLAEASLDNYQSPKRKKQYRGAWWQAAGSRERIPAANTHVGKDSGVFLSSDSSGNEDGFAISNLLPRKQLNLQPILQTSITTQKSLVKKCVERVLEKGHDVVDLSHCELDSVSNQELMPLRDLVRPPKFNAVPSSQELYHSFRPLLEIFLSGNSLRKFPGELTNLSNLTVLSLRSNRITELPHSIGKLHNLVELNVSNNCLRWLPWELLRLIRGRLKTLHVAPNPFLKPYQDGTSEQIWTLGSNTIEVQQRLSLLRQDLDLLSTTLHVATRSWLLLRLHEIMNSKPTEDNKRAVGPVFISSSGIQYFSENGSFLPNARVTTSTWKDSETTWIPTLTGSDPECLSSQDISPALSFFELALQACARAFPQSELSRYLPTEIEDVMARPLQVLQTVSDEGGKLCSHCRRSHIISRAERMEFWHYSPHCYTCYERDLFLPFLRPFCTRACASRIDQDSTRVPGNAVLAVQTRISR